MPCQSVLTGMDRLQGRLPRGRPQERMRDNVDDQQNEGQTITAGKVIPVYVEEEMQKSYIDYA